MMCIVQRWGKVTFMLRMLISQTEHELVPACATFFFFARHVGMTGPPCEPMLGANCTWLSPWYRRTIPRYLLNLRRRYVAFQDLNVGCGRRRGFGAVRCEGRLEVRF